MAAQDAMLEHADRLQRERDEAREMHASCLIEYTELRTLLDELMTATENHLGDHYLASMGEITDDGESLRELQGVHGKAMRLIGEAPEAGFSQQEGESRG